jgi:hypothetical protein
LDKEGRSVTAAVEQARAELLAALVAAGENAEMVMRMCEVEGYTFTAEIVEQADDWVILQLRRKADD